jgi:acyl-CoA thioesterase
MPSTKHITQGSTLISNFSTNQGTFSTKTRKNRVEKYFGASFCAQMVNEITNATKREAAYSKVFIHDFASLEVRMVEMHHTSWLSSTSRHDRCQLRPMDEASEDSRARTYHLLFIHDFRIPAMFVLFHYLHAFHPVMNIMSVARLEYENAAVKGWPIRDLTLF